MLVQLYEPIYYFLVTVFSLIAMSYYRLSGKRILGKEKDPYYGTALFLCLFLVFFIGLRPIHYFFGDTVNYAGVYEINKGLLFNFSFDVENLLFNNLMLYCASASIPISLFFTFVSFLYYGTALLACKKLFPGYTFIAFMAFLGSFSAWGYGVNGIKAGAAASLFLLALAYREKKVLAITIMLVSYGFHHSMLPVIFAFFASLFYKKTKMYYILWVVCLIIAVLHIQYFQFLFSGFADEKGARYLTDTTDTAYLSGFRLDFILYSAAPILIGYWLIFKKKVVAPHYELWLRLYLLLNSMWLLCMYASFTNRIAYLSWFLLPILIIYPFVGIKWFGNKAIYMKRVFYYHLGFTLFMYVIYYTIFH